MIILTRLGGHEMAVNPDLIERADRTPDTILTMADGHKLVVAESLTELVARVRHWRASVAAEAYELVHDADGPVLASSAEPSSLRTLRELAEHVADDAEARGQVVPIRGREV